MPGADVPAPALSLGVSAPIMHGLFTASTWAVLTNKFHRSADTTLCPPDTNIFLELPDLPQWVATRRPQQWCVGIQNPEKAGGLAALEWLRSVSGEFTFGGTVSSDGRWCLYVRGTLNDRWIGHNAKPMPVPCPSDDSAVTEYLRIGVSEGTTMLSQLHSERCG
jgi:hypothetical protein